MGGPVTFSAVGVSLTLHFRQRRLCKSVRFHGSCGPVSALSTARLEQMVAEGRVVREELLGRAFEVLQSGFWEWAKEEAIRKQVGRVSQAGRSGGWIEFQWDEGAVWRACEIAEESCRHCELGFEEHAGGKCLFEPTEFDSAAGESLLERLRDYFEQIDRALTEAPERWAREFEAFIDLEWEGQRALGCGGNAGAGADRGDPGS